MAVTALGVYGVGCTSPTKTSVGVAENRAPSAEEPQTQGELFENPLNRGRHAHAAKRWLASGEIDQVDWSDDSHFCAYFQSGVVDHLQIQQPFFVQPGAFAYVKAGKVYPDKPAEGGFCELRTRAIDSRNKTSKAHLEGALVNGHFPFEKAQKLHITGCLRDRDWRSKAISDQDDWVNLYIDDPVVDLLVCYPSHESGKPGILSIGELRSILRGPDAAEKEKGLITF